MLSSNNMHCIRQQLGKVWLEHKSLKHVTEENLWIIHWAACPDNAIVILYLFFCHLLKLYYLSICLFIITISRVVCRPKCVAICWLFIGGKNQTICFWQGDNWAHNCHVNANLRVKLAPWEKKNQEPDCTLRVVTERICWFRTQSAFPVFTDPLQVYLLSLLFVSYILTNFPPVDSVNN